jgi:hypothetical protein
MPTPNDPCVTYWIRDETCTDPFAHGYVGITSNQKTRSRHHLRSGRFPAGATIVILHQGSRTECAAVEKLHRPNANIGWNRSGGGGRWRKAVDPSRRARLCEIHLENAPPRPPCHYSGLF